MDKNIDVIKVITHADGGEDYAISRSCYYRLYNKTTPIFKEVTTDGKKR